MGAEDDVAPTPDASRCEWPARCAPERCRARGAAAVDAKAAATTRSPRSRTKTTPLTTTTLRTPSAFDSNLLQLPPFSRRLKISLNDHAGKCVAMAALNLRDPDLVAAGELLAKRRGNDLFGLGPVTSHRKSTPCGGATLAVSRTSRSLREIHTRHGGCGGRLPQVAF